METRHVDGAQVTVVCTTFNHGRYIEKALDSFLSQKTDFSFKILVHDDCSTDGTKDILLKYKQNNPDVIELILQEENLYSQGIDCNDIIKEHIHTPYVALCEGDDYWISDNKLQIQYSYMQSHPECSLFVHSGMLFDDQRCAYVGCQQASKQDCFFGVEDVILGGGGMFPTNSMFFRTDDYLLPPQYLEWGVGDYPRCIFLATRGRVFYLAKPMSAYRLFAQGSWSSQMASNVNDAIEGYRKRIEGLRRIDAFLAFEYHDAIDRAVLRREREILILQRDWKSLWRSRGDALMDDVTPSSFVTIFLKCKAPSLVPEIKRVRSAMRAMLHGGKS